MHLRSLALALASALCACSTALPITPPLPAGTYDETVDDVRAGGFPRTARIHVPSGHDDHRPLPLVVALHGAFSGAEALERESNLSRLADREGFAVAYPNGYGFFGIARHWNSGHCCGPARAIGIDDVDFVDRVIDHVSERIAIDPDRIYLVGFSNGGMLAHRYAAERAGRIAAVAVVAGAIGGRPATGEPVWRISRPALPVPLLMIHGAADERIPFDGTPPAQRSGRSWLSVDDAVAFWREHNATTRSAVREEKGAIVRLAWQGEAPVVLFRIENLGHVWPDRSRTHFDAAETIWRFFAGAPAVRAAPHLREATRSPDIFSVGTLLPREPSGRRHETITEDAAARGGGVGRRGA